MFHKDLEENTGLLRTMLPLLAGNENNGVFSRKKRLREDITVVHTRFRLVYGNGDRGGQNYCCDENISRISPWSPLQWADQEAVQGPSYSDRGEVREGEVYLSLDMPALFTVDINGQMEDQDTGRLPNTGGFYEGPPIHPSPSSPTQHSPSPPCLTPECTRSPLARRSH